MRPDPVIPDRRGNANELRFFTIYRHGFMRWEVSFWDPSPVKPDFKQGQCSVMSRTRKYGLREAIRWRDQLIEEAAAGSGF